VTAKARSAVVRVKTDAGGGSGFIIDPNGLVLTANNVITDAKTITVFLEDGTSYAARVHGRYLVRDLALLKIEATNLPTLELGDVIRVSIGSEVVAADYPLGLAGFTVTKGVPSSLKYDAGRNTWVVQTDSAINPGNSGGPLLNLQGQVVGLVAGPRRFGDFSGWAISANTVKLYLDRLKAGQVVAN
jgi:S1-C subfamily serine protease